MEVCDPAWVAEDIRWAVLGADMPTPVVAGDSLTQMVVPGASVWTDRLCDVCGKYRPAVEYSGYT